MSEVVEDKLTQAAQEWLRLYKAGDLTNDEVYKGWLGVLTLERRFDDNSILAFSDKWGTWRFYRDDEERRRGNMFGRE